MTVFKSDTARLSLLEHLPPDVEVVMRVTRGRNWESEPHDHDPVRAAYRSRNAPDTRSVQIGFRCAAPPLPAPGSSPP